MGTFTQHTMKTALIAFALLSLVAFAASESGEVPDDEFMSWPDRVESTLVSQEISKMEKSKTEKSELLDADSKSKQSDTVQAGWWRRRRRRRRRRWWGSSTERNQKNHARERVNKERSWKHALRERAVKKERGGKWRVRQAAAAREQSRKAAARRAARALARARARAAAAKAKALRLARRK